MDNGSIILNMDMYEVLTGDTVISILINQTGTGHGQKIMAGSGFPITNGDGRRSIMVVGSMTIGMVGFGYQIMNGDRHG